MIMPADLIPVGHAADSAAVKSLRILWVSFLIGSVFGVFFGDHFISFALLDPVSQGLCSRSVVDILRCWLHVFRPSLFIIFLSSSYYGWIILPFIFASFGFSSSMLIARMLADRYSLAYISWVLFCLFFLPLCSMLLAGECSFSDSRALFGNGYPVIFPGRSDSLIRLLFAAMLSLAAALLRCFFLPR